MKLKRQLSGRYSFRHSNVQLQVKLRQTPSHGNVPLILHLLAFCQRIYIYLAVRKFSFGSVLCSLFPVAKGMGGLHQGLGGLAPSWDRGSDFN